jgi:hypothetical protein
MRYQCAAVFAALCLTNGLASAKSAPITQYVAGTISGDSTTDTYGYFSAPGTNLNGAPVRLFFQYQPTDFVSQGCGAPPGSNCALYLTRPAGDGHLANVATAGALVISVQIKAVRRSFAPFQSGLFYDYNTAGSPGQLQLGADNVYAGTPGALVNLYYEHTTSFGAELTPANNPVNVGYSGAGNQTAVTVSTPLPGHGKSGPETLTFTISSFGR